MTIVSGLASRRKCSDSRVRIFSGWKTGMFAASATSFTGEKDTSWPRPRGRSGWVMTATIWKSDWAKRCLSVGTAKFGVPQKRRRMVGFVWNYTLRSFVRLQQTQDDKPQEKDSESH